MDLTGVKSTGIQQQSCSSSSSILSEEESGRKRAEEYSSCFHSVGSGISHSNGAAPAWYYIPNSMQVVASGGHHNHSGNSAAYFHWPPSSRLHGTAEERAAYFSGLQKHAHLHAHLQAQDESERDHSDTPLGQQASTLLDLMTIRAFHSKLLRRFSLGTAIGFRNQKGVVTNIPAIVVFVAHKVHKEWLNVYQLLPRFLEGPGGIWCDVDVVEFSYYGTPAVTPKEQVYTELVEGLRGNNSSIGPGSQVASQETYGTLGAIVQSKTGSKRIGFLTNRHVAVDLDYPNQKMFHPLPPNLGPGVYLGAVERATSFITDDLWYGIFASMNPETFVRADGAFIPFGDCFDLSRVTTTVKGLGNMGDVMIIDLQAPVGSIVGRQVVKARINKLFDLEGDSGSLILITEEGGRKPRPVGIIWGGTANRGRLKLRTGYGPENWTSGVDLGRLLDLLQLSLITSDAGLAVAAEKQRNGTSQFLASSSQQEPHLSLFGDEGLQHQQGVGRSTEVQTTRHIDTSTQTTLGFLDFGFSSPEGAGDKGKGPSRVEEETSENEELSIGFKLFARDIKKRKP